MLRSRPLRPLLALATLLAAQAILSSPLAAQRDEVRSASGVRRRCGTSRLPEALPAADALVDSAALVASAARLGQGGRGWLVASLRYDISGIQVRRRVVDRSMDAVLSDSLERQLFELRRTTTPAPAEWAVRLRLELGDPVRLRVLHGQVCPPVSSDRALMSSPSGFDVRAATADQAGTALATDPGVVWVQVQLDERGAVINSTVLRGYRRGAMDERVRRYVRTLSFEPALEDGYAVPSELEVQIRVAQVP